MKLVPGRLYRTLKLLAVIEKNYWKRNIIKDTAIIIKKGAVLMFVERRENPKLDTGDYKIPRYEMIFLNAGILVVANELQVDKTPQYYFEEVL